ncbi:uncharacterized protein LOC141665943 [Apium graveolens]|uniref:uncharacterized protein LOC141665943 n=1 Tax=Apium graveolens TaxID=4045 RepID=UPI003D7A0E9A
MLNFHVVKAASTYNAIMGRTWIHAFKVVPSTYHMVLKFPTRNGVGEAKGDQKMARSCYVAELRPDGTGGKVPTIEDMDTSLWMSALGVVRMMNYEGREASRGLGPSSRRLLRTREADMPGIDPNLITHMLNVDPTQNVVKQMKRTFALDRLEAIKPEVDKLVEAGFIEEVQFSEWLANPVMVKKGQ